MGGELSVQQCSKDHSERGYIWLTSGHQCSPGLHSRASTVQHLCQQSGCRNGMHPQQVHWWYWTMRCWWLSGGMRGLAEGSGYTAALNSHEQHNQHRKMLGATPGMDNARHRHRLKPSGWEQLSRRDLWVLWQQLSMSQQRTLAAKRQTIVWRMLSTASWSEMILLLCTVLEHPHIEYCVWFWASQQKKDVKVFECIQRRVWSTSIDFCGKAGTHK